MRRTHLALCLIAALGAGCASETRYRPAEGPGDYGYREQRIESDRWRVAFRGNSMTELESVEQALLYRAAELTLEQGFSWFRIVDRDTVPERRLQTSGFHRPFVDGFRHSYFHPRFGWYTWYDPFWDDDVRVREVTQYEASAEIELGRGAKPDESRVYAAREVEENLRGQIRWPEQREDRAASR